MKEAAQSLIVGPAKAVNPKIKVVIKYPNWYEHFAYAGFNLEAEPRIFDGIYTGTETRDPVLTHQHLQTYQSYSIMRYFENVKPGGNGGGWVDPFARITLDRYAEQIALTVLAKAREITLFCFSDLLSPIRQPDGSMKAASRVAPVAGETLERADALLSRLGNPVGVSAYKPYHSSGEDFLHSFLGMIGIPIELTPQFREDAPVVFLNESARFDPTIVARIEKQLRAGKSIVITSGLLKALQGKGIEQIVDLEVSDRRVLTRRFSNFWGGVWEAERDILLPQVRYATNDSWEEITALAGRERLPAAAPRGLRERPALRPRRSPTTSPTSTPCPRPPSTTSAAWSRRACRSASRGRAGCRSSPTTTTPTSSTRSSIAWARSSSSRTAGTSRSSTFRRARCVPGQPRGDATVFSVFLEPHSYRAFARRRAGASGASAHAFGVNQRLGRGVNIIGYDPIWQDRAKGRFQEKHFAAIKDAGFDSVRINLHPFKHMDPANGYALKPSWLDTLDWAVKGALAARLAVILDMHEFGAMAEDPAGRKEAWLAFWRQVAPRFKDAPDDVVFELLNEPNQKLTPEMWNDYLKEGLAIVRATNPTRTVIVGRGALELDRRAAERSSCRRTTAT